MLHDETRIAFPYLRKTVISITALKIITNQEVIKCCDTHTHTELDLTKQEADAAKTGSVTLSSVK
jgi:hypothetical protein